MIGPYALNAIYTGDCREVMGQMPAESIGMILTSPPYNVGLNYEGWDDNMPENRFREFNREWVTEAYRIIADGGRAYFILSDKMLWWFREMAEGIGWAFAQKLTWCKPNFVGTAGRVSGDWNYMTEDILLFRKGKRTAMRNGNASGASTHNYFVEVIPQSNHKDGRIHPAQLPISLCMKIIDRTPGEPVLDPFTGSGSVLVAAKTLGRPYIGIEIVDTVTERAQKRLNTITPPLLIVQPQQPPLFVQESR